jgi:hypothetical protein
MATRELGGILAQRVPFSLTDAESLSWSLGAELADRKPECARLEHADSGRDLTVYEATDNTVIARFRTAVGREKFFGLALTDFRAELEALPPGWRVEWADL